MTHEEKAAAKKIHLVLAGNLHQFKDWCRENRIPPYEASFLRDRFDCYGFTSDRVEIHRIGTYWEHPKRDEIELSITALHR